MPPRKVHSSIDSSNVENAGNLTAVAMFRLACAAIICYVMLLYVLPKFSLLRLYVNNDRKLFGFIFVHHVFAHGLSSLAYRVCALMTHQQLDASNPRAGSTKLFGLAARLHSIHQNALEGYAGYFGSILMSTIMNVPLQKRVDVAFLYSMSRIFYSWAYATDCRASRTLCYFVGQCSIISLFMAVVCRQ